MSAYLLSCACLYHACPLMSCAGGGERHDGSVAGVGTVPRKRSHFRKPYLCGKCTSHPCSLSLRAAPSFTLLHRFVHLSSPHSFSTYFPTTSSFPLSFPFLCLPLFLSLSITHSIISPLLCITPRLSLAQTFWSLSPTLPWHNAGIISDLMEVAIFCRGE